MKRRVSRLEAARVLAAIQVDHTPELCLALMDFERVLASLQRFFDTEGVRYAVVGGFGLHAYGLARATFDVDLAVEATIQERLVAHLESGGYETLNVTGGYSNHLHPDRVLGRLDFVYVRGDTAETLFAGCRRMPIVGEVEAPVPRPEHLAAMKVQAMKNDPERTFQEMADLQFLVRLPGVDRDEVRRQFVRHGLEERYRELERSL